MKLTDKGLSEDRSQWEAHHVNLPAFDVQAVRTRTYNEPTWLHFGAGNLFRAYPSVLQQTLLNNGITDKGIIVAEGFDFEIIDEIFAKNDNNSLSVTLKGDGTTEMNVISSVTESLRIDQTNRHDYERLIEIFKQPSLQMVSFTITEKGYNVHKADGSFFDDVANDVTHDITLANSYIGKLVSLLHERFKAGAFPLTLVSMDNCSHNGTRLYEAVTTLADAWHANEFVDAAFIAYIKDSKKVAYPWSMIDKITPRPDDSIKDQLAAMGFTDSAPIVTKRGSYVAPFVNAEETEYLVIEDIFTNGRPPLEKAGVIFSTRETVDKVEKMKVCTCLNPLHTALAIFGCVLSYDKISEEMKDEDLVALIKKVGYVEGLPVVVNPGIIDPKSFIDEVINVRFPNPFMPDTPQRIATDTSQKLSIRFLETVKAYVASPTLDVNSLEAIPFVLAGWCRYLMGINDDGQPFEISNDPLLSEVQPHVSMVKLGEAKDYTEILKPILSNRAVFSIDLYEAGLAPKIVDYFTAMVSGPGAVRETLRKLVK